MEMETENSTKKLTSIIVAVSFLVSSIGGFIFGIAGGALSNKYFPGGVGQSVKNAENTNQNNILGQKETDPGSASPMPSGSDAVVNAIKKADPAVVSIIISKDLPKINQYNFSPFGNDPFFNQFFGQDFNSPQSSQQGTQKQEVGGGTGFIVSSDGMIVTNKHVVNDSQADYTVLMNNGEKEYPAKVLAIDPANDLAIIKIDQNNLPTVTLGDSDKLDVGSSVITIGNALGEFRNTASMGIISGLRRSITASGGVDSGSEQLTNIIQTDAAIYPGNSGGPLVNLNGDVVGVNVAMAQQAENIGFAIPINDVKKIINDVKTKGRIVTPYIGVRYMLINSDVKSQNNLPVDYGALVIRGTNPADLAVVPGSPADKAGIEENDIILEVNGTKVDDNNPLQNLISKYSVGDEVTLKVLHKGNQKDVKVTLEERKSQ